MEAWAATLRPSTWQSLHSKRLPPYSDRHRNHLPARCFDSRIIGSRWQNGTGGRPRTAMNLVLAEEEAETLA